MLGSRQNAIREFSRVQREEHAITRALIESQREEARDEREEIRRAAEERSEQIRHEGEACRAQIRREGEARTEQMRREGEERMAKMREEGDARSEEMREFMREILLRNEKVYTAVIAEAERGRKQLEEGTEQIRANTKAVLSVLDRFNGR